MIKNPKSKEEMNKPFAERQAGIERQLNAVQEVVKYVENKGTCRRVQLLQYFDELFDPKDCGGGCDNCENTNPLERQDLTQEAQQCITLVETLANERVNATVVQCRNIFRGMSPELPTVCSL